MENRLVDILGRVGMTYVKVEEEESLIKIYNLLVRGDLSGAPTKEIEYFYYGVYYQIRCHRQRMMMAYHQAIKLGNSYAMNNLGTYFLQKEENPRLAKLYYQMGARAQNPDATLHLALFYGRRHRLAKLESGLLAALRLGHPSAVKLLTEHYHQHPSLEGFRFAIAHHQLPLLSFLNLYFEATSLLVDVSSIHLSSRLLQRKIDHYAHIRSQLSGTYFTVHGAKDITQLVFSYLLA